jgi:hypothetical protein
LIERDVQPGFQPGVLFFGDISVTTLRILQDSRVQGVDISLTGTPSSMKLIV